MYIEICTSRKDVERLIKFKRTLYKDDLNFKNNDELLLKEVISKKSTFNKENFVEPILVVKEDKIKGVCVLIHSPDYSEYLQIAFLDFINEDAEGIVKKIIDYAKIKADELKAKKVIIGLNGHVNYGLGILVKGFEYKQSFGGSYNKDYYGKVLEKFSHEITYLDAFYKDINDFNLNEYEPIIKRINNKFTYRYLNKSKLYKEAKLYNDLNNIIFKSHKFYYSRSVESDYELLKDLTRLIDNNNLIIALKDNKAVGFLLWYPDYNEVLKDNEWFSFKGGVKAKLLKNKIKKCKIVEIGVLPEYKNSGVIMGLFNNLYGIIKDKYSVVESSWILYENFRSRNFGVKFEADDFKKFAVYELNV